LQVFDETGENSDQITAAKAVYIPAENKNFTAYFAGNVNIETRDALKVKTEQVTYTKETETAEIEELVEFERENVRGKSVGALCASKKSGWSLLERSRNQRFAVNSGDELAQ
jgi:lipopolysaccharide assembly outer membrane protein LptD (OstA)